MADALRTSPNQPLPPNVRTAYEQYVDSRFLQPIVVVPVFLVLFVGVLYLMGKVFSVGMSRFIEPAIPPCR